MAHLWFLLDLRSIPPFLLCDLKQVVRARFCELVLAYFPIAPLPPSFSSCPPFDLASPYGDCIYQCHCFLCPTWRQSLLRLADLYVACAWGSDRLLPKMESLTLPNRIGLCYIHRNESASTEVSAANVATYCSSLICSVQLKIAFAHGGDFSLLNFHHAVNNLPVNFPDEFSGHLSIEGNDQVEVSIGKILSNELLDMCGGEGKLKKVIVVTASTFSSSESLHKILMNAATQHVKIEFVLLEQETILCNESLENFNRLIDSLNQLQNCVVHKHVTDTWILYGLVKAWLQDLRNDIKALQAHFIFKHAIYGSSNQISCLLSASTDMILDGFFFCQTCRSHGYPIGCACSKTKRDVRPVTFLELEESGLIDKAVKVGGRIALFLPSSENKTSLQMENGLIKLNVVERTNLASVNEGVIMGTSYFVTPLCHEWEGFSDEHDNLEMNAQTFYGICESLFHLDQGLVCSSSCNLETMTDGNFASFYLLQPSYHGPMLLRRLASSEEILPIPSQLKKPIVAEEIRNSIQASLSKIEFRDYNPLEHERGLYPQLNKLVEEILELGPLPTEVEMTPKVEGTPNEKASTPQKPSATVVMSEKENANRDENTLSSISDEWERLLIVDGMDESFSADSISVSTTLSSLPTHEKSLDERTSRILERLEAPKSSAYISASVASGQTKKPLLPDDPSPIQPLRPNFQRMKRKLR